MQTDNQNINIPEDVYSEEFLALFYKMLEKFVNEYDDMAQMGAIKKAGELLAIFNDQ